MTTKNDLLRLIPSMMKFYSADTVKMIVALTHEWSKIKCPRHEWTRLFLPALFGHSIPTAYLFECQAPEPTPGGVIMVRDARDALRSMWKNTTRDYNPKFEIGLYCRAFALTDGFSLPSSNTFIYHTSKEKLRWLALERLTTALCDTVRSVTDAQMLRHYRKELKCQADT